MAYATFSGSLASGISRSPASLACQNSRAALFPCRRKPMTSLLENASRGVSLWCEWWLYVCSAPLSNLIVTSALSASSFFLAGHAGRSLDPDHRAVAVLLVRVAPPNRKDLRWTSITSGHHEANRLSTPRTPSTQR